MLSNSWKGALAALFAGAGLAWSQATEPSIAKAEKIMVVHENGAAIRCRVLTAWELQPGVRAHQLQAVESGELLTIVDDPSGLEGVPRDRPRAMPKRIFHWGNSKTTPPAGSPTPPAPPPPVVTTLPAAPAAPVEPPAVVIQVSDTARPVVATLPATPALPAPPAVPTLPAAPAIPATPATSAAPTFPTLPTLPPAPAATAAPAPTAAPVASVVTEAAPQACTSCEVAVPGGPTVISTTVVGTDCSDCKPEPGRKLGERLQGLFGRKDSTLSSREVTRITCETADKIGVVTVLDSNQAPVVAPELPKHLPALPESTGLGPASGSAPEPKVDVLLMPERFNPAQRGRTVAPVQERRVQGESAPIVGEVVERVQPVRPAPLPSGSQSVLAARNGLSGPVAYVPVPHQAVPIPHRPPTPPAPALPSAPQLNSYVNAFSPPPEPRPSTPPVAVNAFGLQAPPAAGFNPQLAMQQEMMRRQQLMQMQAMQPMQPQMPSDPMSPMNAPRHYAGPAAPNPFGSPMAQTSVQQIAYMQPVMVQPPQAPGLTNPAEQVEKMISVLRESPYPSQREWASIGLASLEGPVPPQVLDALMRAAAQDAAPSVRAGCVNALARMTNASTLSSLLAHLRNDADPRVRQEVEQACARLGLSAQPTVMPARQ